MPNPLRRTFLRKCDYPLEGLPDAGVCPECGTPFDGDFIVLRGRPVMNGEEPNGQRAVTPRRVFLSAGWLLAVLLGTYFTTFIRDYLFKVQIWATLVGLGTGLLFELTLDSWTLFQSARSGVVIVWLSPNGIGQQPIVEPGSPVARLATIFPLFQWSAFAVFITAIDHSLGLPFRIIAFSIIVAWGVAMFVAGRRKRPYVLPPSGIRPGLFAWDHFHKIRWRPIGGGVFELWTRKTLGVRPSDVTHVRIELTPEQATEMERLLHEWTGGRADMFTTLKSAAAPAGVAASAATLSGRYPS